ncbi:MAG: diguanylate cyclase [Deltaproteobacteria bacterium]|nr:diguanylate cyclase [Deltaproteobacteria bacterium]
MERKLSKFNISAKFLGAIGIILAIFTAWDISYNAEKEKKITEKVVKDWAFFFAENVRVTLNELMRKDRMDMRFDIFKSMSEELTGLKDVRVIRGKRTDEIFREINERDIIPLLETNVKAYRRELSQLEDQLHGLKDADKRYDMEGEIAYLKEDIDNTAAKIRKLRQVRPIDKREEPRDEADRMVLEKGEPVYSFEGDNARVLIPYTVREKGCAEKSGCHKYAGEGDVLGAISLEFSIESINREISENNVKMAGLWLMRVVILFAIISFLLTFIITKNLRRMLNTFKLISQGDFSTRVPVKNSDEIGILSDGFNNMASSLERTKKELDQHLLELYTLYNISKTMNSTLETETLLTQLVKDISESMKIDKIIIMLLTVVKEEIYVASAAGFDSKAILDFRVKAGEGPYGKAVLTGKSRLIDNVEEYSPVLPEEYFSPEINSALIVPFLRRGEVLGLICGYKEKPNKFKSSDEQLFNSVAEHVCLALENAKLFEETKTMAITDGLTGLYNKQFFQEKLDLEIERARRKKHDLSIILMDLDNFKHYNDTNGHPAGDVLLRSLAALLNEVVRKIDLACRYGGEEFVIILPETDKAGAGKLAGTIVEKIAGHPFDHREKQPLGFVSASIGVAAFPSDGRKADEIVKKADQALYRAKEKGKNRVVAYSRHDDY